ncbi:DUF6286 domain-containing protein [Zhihengliuella halotolerans]|uniref:DUF6286 domain-containing protein n=1 Tax=Zhihengliuella halotolerans TaxID=370736 RepID=A0A4Q8AFZ3_9MICC|nr:DUF6286 domain-containing protein [Zhihengliuella halotolerans]RZU63260.1 hypothetical protein EV380_2872 [Zhihengliuella halotolerans]
MSNHSLSRRPARVTPATIVALVIAAAGAGLVTLAVLRLSNGTWPGAATAIAEFGAQAWGAPLVAAGGAAAAVIGLVLLLCAVLPGRPSSRPARSAESVEAVVTRRGIERMVEHRVGGIDGVSTCRARVRGHKVSVVARTPLRDHSDLSTAVSAASENVLRSALDGSVPRTTVRMVSSS